jgi:putative membrane protein insertion efficiency factor
VILAAVVAASILAFEGQTLAIGAIHVYQRTFAGLVARAGLRCRFAPTCSRYAEAVIAADGPLRGGWKAVKRISRCGPWTRMGTVDLP